ncbi:MAG: PQQ-binding-like beta-propeller repeat protein [Tessaracoccus sp.]|uniref:outer membrane protein assembly factor BamB family protein n=1 Tax=Tessaracoccus sp. TaxID=1971211 RepID=UPI001ED04045|nr:PQQ-binding-like beta-propeller repeat protein [Tessaracoccus sp.]MBK7822306.1 PQQ-binding-like beta-propeller repeat protein [Tessaracoccus sp.]
MNGADFVDLDELAAEEEAGTAPRERRPWVRSARRLLRPQRVASVVGVLVLALVTGWAVLADRSPLSAQVLGMRHGPEVGWTIAASEAFTGFDAVEGDLMVLSNEDAVRARRGSDGALSWEVTAASLGIGAVPVVSDLPGTPWVAVTARGFDSSPQSVGLLLDRATGRVAHRLELPAPEETYSDYYQATTLFSASDGTLLLATPMQEGMSVAKLSAPRVDDRAWRIELPEAGGDSPWWDPQAVARGSYLLIGDGNADRFGRYVIALQASNGERADWLPPGAEATPYGDVAVVETGEGRIAYDLANGAELWRHRGGYTLATLDGVIAEVVDGRLALLSPRTGAEIWSVPSEDEWASLTRWGDDIVVYQGFLGLVGADDGSPMGRVAAFDLATGRQRWRTDLGGTVGEIARGEGQLVASVYRALSEAESTSGSASGVVGLDPETGEVRWDQGLEPDRATLRFGTRMFQAAGERSDYQFLR